MSFDFGEQKSTCLDKIGAIIQTIWWMCKKSSILLHDIWYLDVVNIVFLIKIVFFKYRVRLLFVLVKPTKLAL